LTFGILNVFVQTPTVYVGLAVVVVDIVKKNSLRLCV